MTSERLYLLGIDLMERAVTESEAPTLISKELAFQFRDGLLIALLALAPPYARVEMSRPLPGLDCCRGDCLGRRRRRRGSPRAPRSGRGFAPDHRKTAERLKALLHQGLIIQNDYDAKKAQILLDLVIER